MRAARQANLQRLLNPRHVAIIGGRDAEIVVEECRRIGYRGEIWPVNPRRTEMAGLPCFASVADLPAAPDAVFVAVPAASAVAVIGQLAAAGAGGVVCYTAGFSADGRHGPQADKAVVDVVGDMALVGPNCYGLINYLDKVALWPFAHGGYCPGYGAAVITQSGMLSSDITMNQRSLPLAFMVSAGNQSVLRLEDYLDALCERPEVRAIGLHIEGIQNCAAFSRAAMRALQLGKPVVALKTGTSAIGAQLTVSHTGSLSGNNELYQALFERLGIISVNSPTAFVETLKYLCVCKPVKGARIVGFTCSGGGATMLADHADKTQLKFSALSAHSSAQLEQLLPDIASVSNPLDYTTPIWGDAEKTRPVFTCAAADGFDSALLVQDYPLPGLDESRVFYRNDAGAFIDAAQRCGIPAAVCSTLSENIDAETREWLIDKGAAPMQGIHEALNAIDAARWYFASRDQALAQQPLLSGSLAHVATRQLDEGRAKQRLRRAGFTVPDASLCAVDQAADAADRLGYPVVLKANSAAIAHKTEAGAVVVGLADRASVTAAARAMLDSIERFDSTLSVTEWLLESVQPRPSVELLVSVRQDSDFGMAMTLASGGVLVDLLSDAVTLLLPATGQQIEQALERLVVAQLLRGYRGAEPVDSDRLVQALQNLAEFAIAHQHSMVEIEINPLFVYRQSVCAVDVLMRVVADEPGADNPSPAGSHQ